MGTVLALAGALLCGCAEELGANRDAGALDSGDERDAGQELDADLGVDAGPAVDAARDGSVDAPRTDASPDATRDEMCDDYAQRIESFVQSHRACTNDDDCVIVGDCSHSNFRAVSRSAQAEGQELVVNDPCGWQDGPGYLPRCRQGTCERVKSTRWCGSPQRTDCPAGTSNVIPGCVSSDASFSAGCYAGCSGQGDDAPCTTGYTCQKANVHPCPSSPPGGSTCAACGAEKWLCLPAPACQLDLALTFDGRQAGTLRGDEATEMRLVLKNRTDQTLTFSFEQPCHGPTIAGLAAYDAWDACLAGACPTPTSRVEVTLAPREVRVWRESLIEAAPSQCNMQGLAAGSYTPTFTLPNVQGAKVCGPGASSLTVTR